MGGAEEWFLSFLTMAQGASEKCNGHVSATVAVRNFASFFVVPDLYLGRKTR
jgi:hypothetical protein